MYESAKLQHERSYPLNGTSYANLFINYRPSDWIHKGTMFTKDGRLGFASKAAHDTYYRKVRAGMPSSRSWAIPAAVACACALVAFLWRRRSTKGALPKGSGAAKQQSRGGKKRR